MLAGLEVRRERVEPLAAAWRCDVSTGASPAIGQHLGHARRQVVAQVGLVEQHHRCRAARPGQCQVALQAPQVEVVGERRDDDHGVHVGGDDLLLGTGQSVANWSPRAKRLVRGSTARSAARSSSTGSSASQSPTTG